jgi:hypothetical protein
LMPRASARAAARVADRLQDWLEARTAGPAPGPVHLLVALAGGRGRCRWLARGYWCPNCAKRWRAGTRSRRRGSGGARRVRSTCMRSCQFPEGAAARAGRSRRAALALDILGHHAGAAPRRAPPGCGPGRGAAGQLVEKGAEKGGGPLLWCNGGAVARTASNPSAWGLASAAVPGR